MNELIYTSLALSLIVQFIYACFWEGMIFGKVAGWLMENNRVPLWMQKITFACPICMTPYYSLIILALLRLAGYLIYPAGLMFLIVLIASGLSTIFSRLYD